MTKFLYSVIVCSYNKISHLKDVIPKIRKERPENEIILSDDCSDDGTIEWAKGSGLFDVIISKEKREPYCLCTVRNEGVKRSSKDKIVFLDSDCYPEDGYFFGHDFIFSADDSHISVGFTNHFDREGKTIIGEDPRLLYLNGNETCDIEWNDCFGGNIAFSKLVFEKAGLFDEDYNGHWGFEDLDFSYRCKSQGFLAKAHKQCMVKHLAHRVNSEYQSGVLNGVNYKKLISKHGKVLSIP